MVLFISGLGGRTWTGKECFIRSLQDLVVYGGDGVVDNLVDKSGKYLIVYEVLH